MESLLRSRKERYTEIPWGTKESTNQQPSIKNEGVELVIKLMKKFGTIGSQQAINRIAKYQQESSWG